MGSLSRTTIQVTGQEIRPHDHRESGSDGPCPGCLRVHENRLVRYLTVSGATIPSSSERIPLAESRPRFYPPAVPVLSAQEGGQGILTGRWALAVA